MPPEPVAPVPVRLTGRDALRLHLALAGGLLLCAAAFAVELWRALGGHDFSWLYVVEWPLFGAFGIYMWWHLLQGHDRVPAPPRPPRPGDPADGATDAQLEAWRRYVRELDAGDRRTGLAG